MKVSVLTVWFLFLPLVRGQQANACDLNSDSVVNVVDVQLATNMALGTAACTANINGHDVCNVITVQRLITAAIGGQCVVTSHQVTLTWVASTSSGVVGYNVYRSLAPGGPYTMINATLIVGLSYIDTDVAPGQIFYYVATAVDGTSDESAYSNEATAVVPTP